MSYGSTAGAAVLPRRVIGRPENQSRRDACRSGLQGIGEDPSPAPELPHAFECPKPFSGRKTFAIQGRPRSLADRALRSELYSQSGWLGKSVGSVYYPGIGESMLSIHLRLESPGWK